MKRPTIIALLATLAVILIIGGIWFFHAKDQSRHSGAKTEVQKLSSAARQTLVPPPEAKTEPKQIDLMDLATIRKGEGVEHAFIRQLQALPVKFGFAGDLADETALKKWAGRQAHLIAIRTGYYDWKFGVEVRVERPGVAYLLQNNNDGVLRVVEYKDKMAVASHTNGDTMAFSAAETIGNSGAPQVQVPQTASQTALQSTSQTTPQSTPNTLTAGGYHLPLYEYLYTGVGAG